MGAIAGAKPRGRSPAVRGQLQRPSRSRCAEPLHPPSNRVGLAETATLLRTKRKLYNLYMVILLLRPTVYRFGPVALDPVERRAFTHGKKAQTAV